MKFFSRFALVAAALTFSINSASADLVTFGFTGDLLDQNSQPASGQFTGSFTIDTSVIPTISAGGTQADYNNAVVSFTVGQQTFFGLSHAEVLKNSPDGNGGFTNDFNEQVFLPTGGLVSFEIQGGPVSTVALPTQPYDVAQFPFTLFSASYPDPFSFDGGVTSFDGRITSMTGGVAAVPEPSTWAMMILGFFGVGFMTFRRRNAVTLTA